MIFRGIYLNHRNIHAIVSATNFSEDFLKSACACVGDNEQIVVNEHRNSGKKLTHLMPVGSVILFKKNHRDDPRYSGWLPATLK